jgi:hypothetical protein
MYVHLLSDNAVLLAAAEGSLSDATSFLYLARSCLPFLFNVDIRVLHATDRAILR